MKKSVIKDERIEMEKMKIASATFGILVLGIFIDIFYKIYVDAPFNSYKGELIVILIAGAFYLNEVVRKGVIDLFSNNAEKKKFKSRYAITNTILALSFAVVDIMQGAVRTNSDILGLTIGVICFIFVGYFIDVIIMKKSNKNIDDYINKK